MSAGNITISGDGDPASGPPNLAASGGRINLASVASTGDVTFDPTSQLPKPNVESFEQLGHMVIAQGALVDVSGEGGGSVVIRSGKLRIDSSWLFADTLGSVDGAELGIDITVHDEFMVANTGVITTDVSGTGNAGNINIAVDHLRVAGGSQISSSASGPGHGGTVTVHATEVNLDGTTLDSRFHSLIFTTTRGKSEGAGDAGALLIEAEQVRLSAGAQISSSTSGPGMGGTVTVHATKVNLEGMASDLSLASGIFTAALGVSEGAGDAGALLIEAEQVRLSAGAQIGSVTSGPGMGGTVTVHATEVNLDGTTPDNRFPGTAILSSTSGPGPGGDLTMQVDRLVLLRGGAVGSLVSGDGPGGQVTIKANEEIRLIGSLADVLPSALASVSTGKGTPGRLRLMAPSIVVDGSFIGTAPLGNARTAEVEIMVEHLTLTNRGLIVSVTNSDISAGTITINATDTVSISTGGILTSTFGTGTGNAGNIVINTTHLRLTQGGRIDSSTLGPGHGGTVTITASGTVSMAGRNSGIFTNTVVSGAGGTIELQAQQVQLTEEALISSASSGSGNAGDIRIAAQDVELRGDSVITTTVDRGEASGGSILIGGTINAQGDIVKEMAMLTLEGSRITANTDAGDGANIVIGARQVVLDSGSCHCRQYQRR